MKRKPVAVLMFSLIAVVVLVCIAVMTRVQSWTRQGDEVRFLPLNDWRFEKCYAKSATIYDYGFIERAVPLDKHLPQ